MSERSAWQRILKRSIATMVAIGVAVVLVLLLLSGRSTASTPRWFAPDLTGWLILNAVVALLIAGARMARRVVT